MVKKLLAFFKKETVLSVSLLLAALSMLITPPSAEYIGYIDFSVLAMLLSLMSVVGLMKHLGWLSRLSSALISRCGSMRKLSLAICLCCFFFAMLVTNDVALLTFIPLSISALSSAPASVLIYTLSLETVAANLGSVLTPFGNPQNLYIYTHYGMSGAELFSAAFPMWAASLLLVCLAVLPIKNAPVSVKGSEASAKPDKLRSAAAAALFLCCVLSVLRVVNTYICLALVVLSLVLLDRKALLEADYSLLLTFVCFFIFVGNLGASEAVRSAVGSVMAGRELEMGLLLSQVISNVPAALMLSCFTDNASALLRGVDLGGLGTIVASLASLITLRIYKRETKSGGGKYLLIFTLMNVAFLLLLYPVVKFI
ncbi:MAG: SLC13 family permease [Eubacteriales bacterium]|nr:SLC13 family permease [Eubacteriales bacterium]MDD3881354.1 SLC13 family permease [Eubacteriales bacterium]MDD4513681.1 SLC13 family permease [Eubacteriales bacterium]